MSLAVWDTKVEDIQILTDRTWRAYLEINGYFMMKGFKSSEPVQYLKDE